MRRRPFLRTASGALIGAQVPSAGATPEPFEPLSRLPLRGAKEVVVADGGDTAYLAVTDGFAVVDISDPAAPTLLTERRGLLSDRERGPVEEVFDVAVDADLLAVAGPAHGLSFGGLLLYDVSDPAAPRRLDFHETPHPVHNCDAAGEHVYVTANDISDRPVVALAAGDGTLEPVGRWSLPGHDEAWRDVPLGLRQVHDVTVADGVAYVAHWDAGTWLLDVSDPASLTTLGTVGGRDPATLADLPRGEQGLQVLEPPGNAHYAEPGDDGDLLAVGAESWDVGGDGGPSGVDLWDVSDPADPSGLATIDPVVPRDATTDGTWTTAHNFEVVGDRLYSAWYDDGVKVHDVSDPTAPQLLAHWRQPATTRFWTARLARPGECFVATDVGDRETGEGAALYCFPDRPGEQPDRPAIETATPSGPGSPTSGESPTQTATPSPTRSPTATPTRSPTSPADRSTTAGRPRTRTTDGFGPLAAVTALGAATLAALRRR